MVKIKRFWQENEKIVKLGVLILFLIYVFLSLAQKINLTTADLGRHIKNGEILFQTGKIIDTNYYSYTNPEFNTVNHHWLIGPIFYLIYKIMGFWGLSFFYCFLGMISYGFIFLSLRKGSNFWLSTFLCFLSVPLFATRAEIRPEIFSYLFISIFLYLLTEFDGKKINNKIFALFLVLQIFWVNVHILWPISLMLIGVFGIHDLILKNKKIFFNRLFLGVTCLLVSFINPFGINSVIAPFAIFNEYGYRLAENMGVFFMHSYSKNSIYIYLELISFFWLVLLFYSFKKLRGNFKYLILSIVFLGLGFKMIRNIPLLAIYFPLASTFLLTNIIGKKKQRENIFLGGSFLLLLLAFVIKNKIFYVFRPNFGFGLMEGGLKSAEFVKAKKINGPIFNNYDIGGYLIFNFFPEEKVFIDNRPEAYSVSFFDDYYEKITDDKVWENIFYQYYPNIIYFYRHDLTPWGQEFMVQRVRDNKNWAPIYVDDFVIILIRRTNENLKIIENYELDEDLFKVE